MKLRLASAALAVIILADLIMLSRSPSIWPSFWPSIWIVPLALAGWYAADLMSGVVHMVMDYRPSPAGIGLDRLYFYEGSRESADYLALRKRVFARMGPLDRITYDFKNHHPRPDALGRRSMVAQVGSTVTFLTLPFAVIANAAVIVSGAPALLFAMLASFLIGASFAQYFHGTLHREQVPWPVSLMRRLGLLMRPADHRRHHDTLACDFSTINGWSNPLLNRVFAALRRRGHLRDEGLTPQ